MRNQLLWLFAHANLSPNKFLKLSSIFLKALKSVFKASNSAANLQTKGLLKITSSSQAIFLKTIIF